MVEAPPEKLRQLAELRRLADSAAVQRKERYLHDPAGWAHDRLDEHFWSKQVEIAESVVAHRRTAVKSCHGVGKSFSAARFIAWWLDVHPPGTAFVVSTAPTFQQVEAVLWREVNQAANKARTRGNPFIGRILTTEWKLGNEQIAIGRKPADHDPTGFQGIHARYVLVVLDEACGIPKELWIAANTLLSNEDCRILAIGNPDDPTSHFATVFLPDSGWNPITISAFDSPNFTDEVVPDELKMMLVGQTFIDEMIADTGLGSPIYVSKVLGEFPEDASDGVVMASSLARCRVADQEHPAEQLVPVELGVDVGGSETGDKTVIRERIGCKAGRVWRMQSGESEKVADFILAAIVESGAAKVKVDSVGIGWGVAGHLRRMGEEGKHAAQIVKVNVGSASTNPVRFPRLRDEIWWEVGRKHSEFGTWDLADIDDKTAADLLAPKWKPNARGQIEVEKKDETKKRLGRSPDDGDALLLAFYGGWPGGPVFEDDETPEDVTKRLLAEARERGEVPEPLPVLGAYAGDTSTGLNPDQEDNGKLAASPFV